MSEVTRNVDIEKLRELIGTEVQHDGRGYQIIEILEDGPALILQHHEQPTHIQADQHGEARRKVPKTITIQILDPDSGAYSQAFRRLNLSAFL